MKDSRSARCIEIWVERLSASDTETYAIGDVVAS
jgi:hypothetical protein